MTDFDNMKVHVLHNDYFNKDVKIYEMVHIAPQEFYNLRDTQFAEDVKNGYTLQIEGMRIGDKAKPLHDAYTVLANKLGYIMQSKPLVPFTNIDISLENLNFVQKHGLLTFIKVVSTLLVFASSHSSDAKAKEVIDTLIYGDIPKSKLSFLMDDLLLDKRNHIAVKGAMAVPGDVSLVWGKAHAEGLISLLKAYGFVTVK